MSILNQGLGNPARLIGQGYRSGTAVVVNAAIVNQGLGAGQRLILQGFGASGAPIATAYTLTGPSSITVGVPSTYTVTLSPSGGTNSGDVITFAISGIAGSFSPATVTLSTGAPTLTTQFTASGAGTGSLSSTNGGGLTNPSALTVTASVITAASVVYNVAYGGNSLFVVGQNGPFRFLITAADGSNVPAPSAALITITDFGTGQLLTTIAGTVEGDGSPQPQQVVSCYYVMTTRAALLIKCLPPIGAEIPGTEVLVIVNQ